MSPIVFIARDANLLKNTSSLVVDTFTIDLVPFQNGTETFEEVLDVINIDLKKYVEKAMPCAKKDLARIQRREKILTQILDKVHMQMCQIAGREYATLP
jgi:hypothetical protein